MTSTATHIHHLILTYIHTKGQWIKCQHRITLFGVMILNVLSIFAAAFVSVGIAEDPVVGAPVEIEYLRSTVHRHALFQEWKQRGGLIHPQEGTFDHVSDEFCLEIQGGWVPSSYLSLSKDGNILAIGYSLEDGPVRCYYTRSAIEVYEYMEGSNQWKLRGSPLTDKGSRASLSADGTILAAGRYGEEGGMVNIFQFDDGVQDWVSIGKILNTYTDGDHSDYYFGYSLALSDDGKVVAIGHPGKTGSTAYAYDDDWDASSKGLTHIYEHEGNGVWNPIGEAILGEVGAKSGTKISLSADGSIVAIISVGNYYNYISPDEGGVYYINRHVEIYQYSESQKTWVQLGTDLVQEGVGYPHMFALSNCGMYITITFRLGGNTFDFHAYKYDKSENSWFQLPRNDSWIIYGTAVVVVKDEDETVIFRHLGRSDLVSSANGKTIIVKESASEDSVRVLDSIAFNSHTTSPTLISPPTATPSLKGVVSKKSHKKHNSKKSKKSVSKKATKKSSKKGSKKSTKKSHRGSIH